jgi:hypothetical protein
MRRYKRLTRNSIGDWGTDDNIGVIAYGDRQPGVAYKTQVCGPYYCGVRSLFNNIVTIIEFRARDSQFA